MKYNISKELFEAVYNCDITTDKDMLGAYKRINIYEFAFKCKEWALKKGYIIQSELEGYTFENIAYSICRVYFDGDKVYDNYEINNICYQDEKIAIIEACEWVLREVNK